MIAFTDPEGEEAALGKAIASAGNPLDQFLAKVYVERVLVAITLDNGKVYIAWVNSSVEPQLTEYVNVIPYLSGYRDAEGKLRIETEYERLLAKFEIDPENQAVRPDDVEIVIELKDALSFARFDIASYDEFFATPPATT